MKTKKIVTVIMIFVFIICLLIWTIPSLTMGQTVSPSQTPDEAVAELIEEGVVYNQALGLAEPKILPGSILYPIKNLIWALRYRFISDPIRQLQWDVDSVSGKLLELQKLALQQPDQVAALNKALANYEAALSRLKTHLTDLPVSQPNSKNSVLLDKLAGASLEYEKIFNDVASQNISETLQNRVKGLTGQGVSLLTAAVGKLADKESVFNDFSDKTQKNYGGLLNSFRSLEAVLTVENILTGLSANGTKSLKENLYLQAESELKNFSQLDKNKIADVVAFLPGNKLLQEKIIYGLEERSGQTEFFQGIEDKLKQLPVSSSNLKQCQEEIGILENSLLSFKSGVDLAKIPQSVKSLLGQSEGHLKRAKEISSDETQAGTFCGLVNSSGVLLENAQRILEKSQPAEITGQIKNAEAVLAGLLERAKQFNQDDYFRIFDLFNKATVELENAKANWQDNNVDQAIRNLNSFDVISKNAEKALDLANDKLTKAEAKTLGLQKELFQKKELQKFYEWCQTQAGTIMDDLGILPYCLDSKQNSLSMLDWLKKAP
ncbi:MAG TPA: hypothetical protein PKZ02_00570 [Candidatus Paceibacterota bacterium]|nr:hypothetical protein [Candidatus Paceibacterota bacterium]